MANQQHTSIPFWDFIQSLDPNHGPGGGVDHAGPSFPQFHPGFPFGGPGPHDHAGPHHPPPGAGEFGWGPWWGAYGGEHGGPWAHGRGGPNGRRGGGGRGGGRGRRHDHGHRHRDDDDEKDEHTHDEREDVSASDRDMDAYNEKGDTPETVRADAPDPAEVAPGDEDDDEHTCRHNGRRGGRGGRGCGRGGRGAWGGAWGGGWRGRRGGPHHGPHAHHGPPPYPGAAPPFDFAGVIRGFSQHPFFQNLREQAETYRAQNGSRSQAADNNTPNSNNNEASDGDAFAPPVDIFNTERAFVLHVALPGAKKEDVGVDWDADSGVLRVAGVVHRPGDEAFLQTLSSPERRVGEFARAVALPPAGADDKDEVDGFAITARMEDGVLIVTVPKVEREWTEIRKVDIE